MARERSALRSFVSKYLHFHHPAVPLFDSVAAKRLKFVRHSRRVASACTGDSEYAGFVDRFFWLYKAATEGHEPRAEHVKLLDDFLMSDEAM